jgi:hypothetical protein
VGLGHISISKSNHANDDILQSQTDIFLLLIGGMHVVLEVNVQPKLWSCARPKLEIVAFSPSGRSMRWRHTNLPLDAVGNMFLIVTRLFFEGICGEMLQRLQTRGRLSRLGGQGVSFALLPAFLYATGSVWQCRDPSEVSSALPLIEKIQG